MDVSSGVRSSIGPMLKFCLLGPGSFLEVRKILPLLTEASPDHPSFHVVALSLPGYGFSQAPSKKEFRLAQYAEVCILFLELVFRFIQTV
jgi:hypothetical protein